MPLHPPSTAASPLLLTRATAGDGDGFAAALAGAGVAGVRHLALPETTDRVRSTLHDHLEAAGTPRALVNVLPRPTAATPLDRTTKPAWAERMHASLTASLLACQAVGRRMLAERRGAIVTVLAGMPDDAASEVTDQAAVGLMRVLAVEWAHAGVRVATVAPEGEPGPARDAQAAAAAAFLISDEASYVTGTELRVAAA